MSNTEDIEYSSNERRYVMMFKSTFDRKLFPNDFDMWTVRQQCVWINDNVATFFPNVPKSLLDFIPAYFHQADCNRSLVQIPEWLDIDKYHRGQKFVRENFTSIIIAKILGLMHAYSFNEALKAFIMSKNICTPYLGFERYTSSIQQVISWFDGEPWIEGTPANKNMKNVCRTHLMIQSKLCRLDHKQIDNECKITKPWCPDHELFLKDFAAACPFEKYGQRPNILIDNSPYKPKGINNADMAGVQCCVIGSVLLCPQLIGVHNATDEDIEAFCHMWRCYGYYLGIEDKYNFCRGSLEEIKQRTWDLRQYWLLPNLKEVTPEWEHTTRCFVETINYYPLISFGLMPYKMMLLLAMDVLNISMPHLYASMSYAEWIAYKSWRFLFGYVLKFSSVRGIFNKVIRRILYQAINFSPEKKAELKKKSDKRLSNFSIMH